VNTSNISWVPAKPSGKMVSVVKVSSKLFSIHAISKNCDISRLKRSLDFNFETVLRWAAYTAEAKLRIWIHEIWTTARLNSWASFVSVIKINK
jgi:hypothetical protein